MKNSIKSDSYYSPKEVATFLGMSAITIRQWIREVRLTGRKIGPKLVRIPGYAVNAMLEGVEGTKAKRSDVL